MIRRMLGVSTAHITKETSDWLDEQAKLNAERESTDGFTLCHCASHYYGHFVYADEEARDRTEYPEDLRRVMAFARDRHDCDYILFDCDGEEYDVLPRWDR